MRLLFVESSNPISATTGGSFKSLKVILDSFKESQNKLFISFYFQNYLSDYCIQNGIKTYILPYFSLAKLFRKCRVDSTKESLQTCKNPSRNYLKEILGKINVTINISLNVFPILRVIKSEKINLVYCNTGVSCDRAAAIAAIILRRKYILHLRNAPKLNSIDRFLLRKAYKIIAISNYVSEKHSLNNGKLFPKSFVIINPIGKEIEDHLPNERHIRTKNGGLIIGCFSRLITWKGLELLISEFNQFLIHGGSGELLIYGDGPLKKRLIEQIKNLQIESKVQLFDFCEDIVRVMKGCSVVVCPSIEPEPLGRVVIEAMHLGIPVIASNLGGHRETIIAERDGILFNPNNVGDLAIQLNRIFENTELCESISRQGVLKAHQFRSQEYVLRLKEFLFSD